MLQNLYVKNLALIDEVEVDFRDGLNILTGETGAGKSIIIGSINIALGGKVPKDVVRKDADYAYVELIFSIESEETRKKLEEKGIILEDDQLILSRKITGSRSLAKINSETVPTTRIQELTGLLIDIHGQHEHQSLLYRAKHLEILDAYAKSQIGSLKGNIAKLYHTYVELQKKYSAFVVDEEQRKREMDFLAFEINEIESANLKNGEEEDLTVQYKKCLNHKQIADGILEIKDLIGDDNGAAGNAGKALKTIINIVEYDLELNAIQDQLYDLEGLLNDLNRDVAEYISDMDSDDGELEELQERLDIIHNMKLKYGSTVEEILKSLAQKQEKLEQLENYEIIRDKMQSDIKKLEEDLDSYCDELTQIRMQAANKLKVQIKDALEDLNFLNVEFEIGFKQLPQPTANGKEEIEFLISTNPGEPVKPLGKVASGGELSRIMLAIKTVLADSDEIETLIFDEIDTGISGRTAQMVSEKLSLIANKHQVICISHLPQIVSMADVHFLIEKKVEGTHTSTTIKKLNEPDSIRELARLLGGKEITQKVLDSASEMKTFALQYKTSRR